jgi:hypothetical protein
MKKNKLKVFLSGGFKSDWQNKIIEKYKDDFIFFNPREHGLADPDQYTVWDIHFIKQCDILFAYMEETNPSGYGLAFELGLAHGLNKTIILVDERSKKDDAFKNYFRIIYKPSNIVFDNFKDGVKYLAAFDITKF